MYSKVFVVSVAILSTVACLAEHDEFATGDVSQASLFAGWQKVQVDTAPLANTRHESILDVTPMGGRRFIVSYAIESGGGSNEGYHRYKRYDVDTGLKTGFTSVGNGYTGWVRSLNNGPLYNGVCGVCCSIASSGENYVNFVAYHDKGAGGSGVYRTFLRRHEWCANNYSSASYYIANGIRPSAAAAYGGNPLGWKILVVYGRANSIYGKFAGINGATIGSEFLIHTFPSGYTTKSTDIIWNQVANRFIVGFMGKQLMVGCQLLNARVSFTGVVETPTPRGQCDFQGSRNGHFTSVAYDKRASHNPSGRYAWWYENDSPLGKAIRIMDKDGAPTGFEVSIPDGATSYTRPVAARNDAQDPIPGEYATFDKIGSSYIQGLAFDGFYGTSQVMESIPYPDSIIPLAIGTLPSETVYVWNECVGAACQGNANFMAVSDH